MVFVEPRYGGNIGSIARLSKNFGLSELWIVNPKVQNWSEARALASHAQDILLNASIVKRLDEALSGVSYVVGTTSIKAKNSSNMLRTAITPPEFAQRMLEIEGKMALLFGRESKGLLNEELIKCDLIVTIPSNPTYKTLNVASASAILFYELWKARLNGKQSYLNEADKEHRNRLQMLFEQICVKAGLPVHKERLARLAFKNVTSRAVISKREATLMMGVFRQLLRRTGNEESST